MKDKTPKIIAVDFDGTLCTNAYPEIGEPIPYSLLYVTRAKAAGHIITLHTCRQGKFLNDAIAWCKARGITFDYINENVPANIKRFGGDNAGTDAINQFKSEFETIGALSNEQVAALAKLDDTIYLLKESLKNVCLQIGASFAPILQRVAEIINTSLIPKLQKLAEWFNSLTEARATTNFNSNFKNKSVTELKDGGNVVLSTDTLTINGGKA